MVWMRLYLTYKYPFIALRSGINLMIIQSYQMKKLEEIWKALAAQFSENTTLIEEYWKEIEAKYSSKKRHYHNLSHLEYMMGKLEEYKSSLVDPELVSFAIFYHDIVYNASQKDNEQKSAELAKKRLSALGLDTRKVLACHEQILATKAHETSDDSDTNYLLDFDLAILGESPQKYRQYAERIRKEYAIYPDFIYYPGRKKVLQHFLGMDRIFKTDEFHSEHDQQARRNLQAEMERL